jgi:large subunit ribosomal protein L21e
MVKSSKGIRAKSRKKLTQEKHRRGISRFFQELKIGEKVAIDIDPAYYNGNPHHRFQGRIAEVIGKRGRAYILKINDFGKEKIIISNPEHLKRI